MVSSALGGIKYSPKSTMCLELTLGFANCLLYSKGDQKVFKGIEGIVAKYVNLLFWNNKKVQCDCISLKQMWRTLNQKNKNFLLYQFFGLWSLTESRHHSALLEKTTLAP